MSDRMETEDAFIYGDSDNQNADATSDKSPKPHMTEDSIVGNGDEAWPEASNEAANDDLLAYSDLEDSPEGKDKNADSNAGGSDANESDSADSSDSSDDEDLEIILEPGGVDANKQASAQDPSIMEKTNGKDGTILDGSNDHERSKDGSLQSLLAGGVDRIDMVTVPLINSMDMFKIDLDMLDEKPWRQPGADITDYFNFGFNEETWKLYCLKQRQLRTEFNVRKMIPPAMMMMQGGGGMPMANPAMYSAMMNPAFRPEMAGGMFPPGSVPPYMRVGQGHQGGGKPQGADGEASNSNDGDAGSAQDKSKGDSSTQPGKDDGAMQHMAGRQQLPPNLMSMTPQQQLQYHQQNQQQMRMGMPPGYFPGHNIPPGIGGPQRNMPVGAMTPQMQMQMQMHMQMNGRMPMPQNPQAMRPRPVLANTGSMPRPQNPQQQQQAIHHDSRDPDPRDKSRDNESKQTLSRRRDSHERSESRHRTRDRDSTRASSRSRHERERDHADHRKEASKSSRDRSTPDQRRSSRRREHSRERETRDRDGRESTSSRARDSNAGRGSDRPSDRRSSKRQRSPAKEEEANPKPSSRRRR
ncbi:cleavage polyadenylation factor subunit fip1 [Coemansia sp. Benny D160-2]|nr:cleavage polyadenylation factor subunit fip1 [Coemansia sp. Benny D160-2]